MDIKKLYSGESNQSLRTQEAQRSKQQQAAERAAVGAENNNDDSVHLNISSLSQQLSQVLADDALIQERRIAELKKQVENGTYLDKVKSEKVAEAIISEAFANKDLI